MGSSSHQPPLLNCKIRKCTRDDDDDDAAATKRKMAETTTKVQAYFIAALRLILVIIIINSVRISTIYGHQAENYVFDCALAIHTQTHAEGNTIASFVDCMAVSIREMVWAQHGSSKSAPSAKFVLQLWVQIKIRREYFRRQCASHARLVCYSTTCCVCTVPY